MRDGFAHVMQVDPVDPTDWVELPDPWPQLELEGFYPDLVVRARGYLLQADRLGQIFGEIARDYLSGIGQGFIEPFDASEYEVADDLYADFRRSGLAALQELADQFGDRIPSVVWHCYAFMIMRDRPDQEETIFEQKEKLPYPFWVVDAVWHATGKVYGLHRHIQSVLYRHTGTLLEHNCDCNHSAYPANSGSIVRDYLPAARYQEATAALFSHLCGEVLLIAGLKMPFEMGVSPEAAAAMA